MADSTPNLALRSYQQTFHIHAHKYHQVVLPLKGELLLDIAGQRGEVCHQQAALISAGQYHGFNPLDENRFVVVDIPIALAPTLPQLPSFIPLDNGLNHYIQFLEQQLQQNVLSHTCKQQMLSLLLQLLQERCGPIGQIDPRIAAARHYIEHNFQHNISLQQLASVANLSIRQLNELFQHHLGTSPQQYLIAKRMQQAQNLLETSNLSIQHIAEQVGYTSLASFSKRFRQHVGYSPRHFRQLGKQSHQLGKDVSPPSR